MRQLVVRSTQGNKSTTVVTFTFVVSCCSLDSLCAKSLHHKELGLILRGRIRVPNPMQNFHDTVPLKLCTITEFALSFYSLELFRFFSALIA